MRKLLFLALFALSPLAQAGRPLSTDDASTADAGTCQVEAWGDRAGREHAFVMAPACGLLPGLELGAEFDLPNPHDVVRAVAGLALKWVPSVWKIDSAAGVLNFGLKLDGAWVKPAGGAWQGAQTGLLGLATLKASDAWAVHANLGPAHDHASSKRAALLNLALVWTPSDPMLLFVEAQGNSKRYVFGSTVAVVGGRWWLVKDVLGLDLTASRESGVSGPTRWTLGLGWYGIGS